MARRAPLWKSPQTRTKGVAKAAAFAAPEINKWLSGKIPTKVIYVKGRIINFII